MPGRHRHTPRRIRRGEHGSVVIITVAWVVLALFALGAIGYFEGLASLERTRTQARADALAMASAVVARVYGPENRCEEQFGGGFIARIFALNGGQDEAPCPALSDREEGELTRVYGFSGAETGAVQGQFGKWNVDAQITKSGQAMRIYELVAVRDDFIEELANIELVLDYSRSMDDEINGVNKIRRLKEAIQIFFNVIENVRVGAVIFASTNLLQRDIQDLMPANVATLRNDIQNQDVGRGNLGATNYRDSLEFARLRLLEEDTGGRNVIFISDGKPTEPQPFANAENQAVLQGAALRASDIEVFGLFIGEGNDADIMRQIVTVDDGAHLVVDSDPDAIRDFFESFVTEYVCRVPVEDALDDDFPAAETSAWLRPNAPLPGIPLENVDNVDELFGQEASASFRYAILESPDNVVSVYITQAACERLEDDGYDFAFRAGFSLLTGPDTVL